MGNKQTRGKLSPQTIKSLQQELVLDFTDEEIKNWFKEYQSSLREGQTELTREEFKRVYNSLFVGDASEFAEQVFRTFDADGNGTVNFKEFLVGLYVSGSPDTDVKLKWAFQMYDINGDGYITREEMRQIISSIYKMTSDETDGQASDNLTDKMFTDFDTNEDGLISWDEFRAGAMKNPVIVNLLECDPNPDG